MRARVDGVLLSMNFKEGTDVKEGDLLYTIDPAPLQAKLSEAKAGLVEAETKLVKADADLGRMRPLAAMNAVSKRDLDTSIAQQGVASSGVEAAKANVEAAEIDLGYTNVKAPISGIIGLTKAQIGEYVGKPPNAIVLNTIAQLDPMRVVFTVSENDYLFFARIRQAREARGEPAPKRVLELVLSDGMPYPEKGELLSVDSQVNTSTGAITVEAIFPNPSKLLRPGQFAKVRAVKESISDAIVVPKKAIRELQGLKQVLVVDKEDKVSVKTVTIQTEVGNLVVISSGLAIGDRIIPEPQMRLASGAVVKPIEQPLPANAGVKPEVAAPVETAPAN